MIAARAEGRGNDLRKTIRGDGKMIDKRLSDGMDEGSTEFPEMGFGENGLFCKLGMVCLR
jgi:hypothetical protein